MRLAALTVLSFAALSQSARGQTLPPDESQSWTRGRLGQQQPIPRHVQEFSGILVDASCEDRSALNLQQRPAQSNLAVSNSADRSVPGVKVDAKTLEKERADAMAHQNPDVLTRQPDRSCAVTGSTRGFAFLLPNGRLVNLDEGGNTMAIQAVQASPAGRAMLNGTGGGLKPQATLRGRIQGDRLIVEKILKL